mgnify:CR=1 FL=1
MKRKFTRLAFLVACGVALAALTDLASAYAAGRAEKDFYQATIRYEPGAHEPGTKAHPRKKTMHSFWKDAADVIGIDKRELLKQLKEGKSIADVAKSKGIEDADLFDRLLQLRTQKLKEAVQNGELTAEQAQRIQERLPDHLKKIIYRKGFKKPQNK